MKLAAALVIVHLFSFPAVHRQPPKIPKLPNRARYYCQYSSGYSYEICCVWDQNAQPYGKMGPYGAWNCQAWFTGVTDLRRRNAR
jgi:hypothetical protein